MVETFRTKNGYLVICENLPTNTLSVSFDIKVGSGQDKVWGTAHFLEHIIFAGNKKYPKEKVREIFGKYCAKYNGSTSIEGTRFYLKCLDKYFEKCFEVFANIISNPTFDDKIINNEFGIILEEIKRYDDIYSDKVCTLARSMFFRGTQYSHDTLGSENTIKSIDKNTLKMFYDEYYTPNNFIISFAGNINKEKAIELVERYMTICNNTSKNKIYFNPNFVIQEKKCRLEAPTVQSHICIMQKGINYGEKDYCAYLIYLALFGGSTDNFLVKNLRDKYGLVYSCYSYVEEYLNISILSTYCACSKQNIEKAIDIILDIQKNMPILITKKLVENAKLTLEISLLMGRDKPLSVATSNAIDYKHFGKVFDYKDIIDDIKRVTIDEVICVAKKFVETKNIISIISSNK